MDFAVPVDGGGAAVAKEASGWTRLGVLAPEFSPKFGPLPESPCTQPLGRPAIAVLTHHDSRFKDVFLGTGADKREGRRFQRGVEQPAPQRRPYYLNAIA